jgi:hypothetical protein
MAVCAQHHTLAELLCDRFPWTGQPVPRNAEILLVSVPMVEFEKRIGNDGQTAIAPTTHELYRPCLLASCRNRPSIVVPPSVAVRAQKVALRSFDDEPFPRPIEVANPELLRLGVSVVKLQRGDADVVAAVFTSAPSGLDEALLAFHPPPSLTAIRRIVPPLSSSGIRSGPCSDRSLGRVVTSERRASQTEPSSVERSQFSVNDLLSGELAPALLTSQSAWRARRVESRASPRFEWQALKTLPPPVKMATPAVDDWVVAER